MSESLPERAPSSFTVISQIGVTMAEYPVLGTKFGAMPFTVKMKWILKFLVALLTGGFVFPNVMHD
jgi:hypothetical protein